VPKLTPKAPENGQTYGSEEARAYHHGDLRQALIEAAMALVTEEQDYTFSLREVARRAGVSHNAPYNHFGDKQDLLAEVAAAGFVALRKRMLASIAGIKNAETALAKSGIAYVKFGVENPAHYRLMFGSALMSVDKGRPEVVTVAADRARGVLADIIDRGARSGVFVVDPEKQQELDGAVLSAWSAVHGLTMLVLDGRVGPPLKIERIAERLTHTICYGLIRR
jgi:AcrR family transcriptional regulator